MTDQTAAASYSNEIEEIWALFAQEGVESLDTVEAALLSLETNPTDSERIGELFRALHTFKGMARMMGLPTIEALSHCTEDLVGLVRDDGVALTGEMINLLLAVLDEFRTMLAYALAHRQDAADFQITAVMVRLKLMLAQYSDRKSVSPAKNSGKPPQKTAAAGELPFFEQPQSAPPRNELTQEPLFLSPADEVVLAPAETLLPDSAQTTAAADDSFPVIDPINPATDPVYLQIFRDIAEAELWRLQRAQTALAAGDEAAFLEIKEAADNLGHAARQMGFTRIVTALDDLANAVNNLAGPIRVTGLAEITAHLENLRVELLGDGFSAAIEAAELLPEEAPVEADSSLTKVPAFLKTAQDELNHLRGTLIALSSGDAGVLPEIQRVAATLKDAAQLLGYNRFIDSVDNLLAVATEPASEARNLRLNKMELALFEELVTIQEISQTPAPDDASGLPGFVWLFRRWHAVRVFANLAHLREVADDLHQFIQRFLADGNVLKEDTRLANEATYLLRAVYHSCLFYKLDQVARLTLALEDLYARVAQQEMSATATLITLTQTYVAQLGSAIESIREGESPELASLEAMIGQTEEVLYRHSESQPLQVAREVLNLLDISPEFEAVITPDSLLAVGQAMQAGQQFYTILADLDQNETMGLTFYEWSQNVAVTLITNVTVYRDDRTLFDFLLATHTSQETLLATLATIDPTGDCLKLKACALRTNVNPTTVINEQPVSDPVYRAERDDGQIRAVADAAALTQLMESVGKMLTTHITLHHATDRLAGQNLIETITQIVKQAGGNWEYARQETQRSLESWANELRTLTQAETELGANLAQLYELALALRVKPAAAILEPLPRLVEDLAHHQGKIVELVITGAEIELDHSTLDLLAGPVRRLVWSAVAHSIEPPAQRQSAGKSPTGQVVVTVKKQDNRVQVIIEADGGDLNPAAATELAAINTQLQVHQGQLGVSRGPEHGTRFTVDLPLSLVVVDGMVVRVGQVHYIVPISLVHRIVKPAQTELVHTSANGGQSLLRLGDRIIPVQNLPGDTTTDQDRLMVVVEKDAQATALQVDELIGQQQVLIRPLQGYLADVRGVSGCALLGDGEVGMVLNLNQMSM